MIQETKSFSLSCDDSMQFWECFLFPNCPQNKPVTHTQQFFLKMRYQYKQITQETKLFSLSCDDFKQFCVCFLFPNCPQNEPVKNSSNPLLIFIIDVSWSIPMAFSSVCVCVCTCTWMHTCMSYICMCMYLCAYICMCQHDCTHTCTVTCVFVLFLVSL